MYASQPVQAKQLLQERSNSFLSQVFPQWVQVTVFGLTGIGFVVIKPNACFFLIQEPIELN
jgi:hypothetical protein